ncbi:PilL N-terminal domain-containing protein [Pseudomonas cichorii]|nr:PilL N-terminal domain-containing protein [Pseudomonas cichorii]MBX8554357.1 PilL N-terminal domain-containing protein [Pseudomonas cichorii]
MFSTNIPFATGKPVIALFICAFLAGCHTVPPHSPDQTVEAYAQIPAPSDTSKVMRTDRYTLVSIAARPAQQDLLQQIVDIRIPDHLAPTVQDAMTYTLRRSGYQLCVGTEEVAKLYALPLPAAHYQLGPIPLRDALQTLAGPAWQLEVQEPQRQVCFALRAEYKKAGSSSWSAHP